MTEPREYANIRDLLAGPDVHEGTIWFRPASWKGWGIALSILGGRIRIVPTDRTDGNWTPTATEMMGDWVTATPEDVTKEKK